MNYIKERQFCFRLNLSRPDHEELCGYIDHRDRKKYPFLACYLLEACRMLERKERQMPESRISVESMREIKQTIHQAVKEQFGRKERMAEENG